MRINRKRLHMVQPKQTDTIRHLLSHPEQLQKLRFGLSVSHPADLPKICLSIRDTSRRPHDIFAAVAEPAFLKGILRQARKRPGLWERKILLSPEVLFRLSVPLTDVGYAPSYPDDIILLRDDKGCDNLPQILAKDPDPLSKLRCVPKITVVRVDLGQIKRIVSLQVKIRFPKILKFLFTAGKDTFSPTLLCLQVSAGGYYTVCILTSLRHAEALPGLADLCQIKMIYCSFCHSFFPLIPMPPMAVWRKSLCQSSRQPALYEHSR